mmetsp:Transcript_5475/g.7241  ORF Transcript_5475/g.7241 Transcript_5475/m.7241 type:complete len:182 (-) Transcript_5475:11-556(-)
MTLVRPVVMVAMMTTLTVVLVVVDRMQKNCRQNLLIQFDRDNMDQSSLVAKRLLSSPSPPSGSMNNDNNINDAADVKFARLSGTHLTPISTTTSPSSDYDDGPLFSTIMNQLSSLTSKASFVDVAMREARSQGVTKSGKKREEEIEKLALCVSSYVNNVICAKEGDVRVDISSIKEEEKSA